MATDRLNKYIRKKYPTEIGWYWATSGNKENILRWWNGHHWSWPVCMCNPNVKIIEGNAQVRSAFHSDVSWLPLSEGLPDDAVILESIKAMGVKLTVKQVKKHYEKFMKEHK